VKNLILLPGIVAPAAIRYEQLMSRLSHCSVIAKDLEVYAGKTPPANYSIAMEVEGVKRAADDAGFEHFHLYGHSGGGAIGLAFAAAHPDRLLSLTVDEPAYDFTDEMHAEMKAFEPLRSLPEQERIRAFMRLQVSPEVELSPPPGPPPPWMATRPAGIEAFMHALDRHERLPDKYSAVQAPVLYTWGSLTHPRWYAMAKRLGMLFPDFTAVCFDGLHHLNASQQAEPDRVVELLNELWARSES
jgi:pimeloyl-ACP methyl ester carboxylesterase